MPMLSSHGKNVLIKRPVGKAHVASAHHMRPPLLQRPHSHGHSPATSGGLYFNTACLTVCLQHLLLHAPVCRQLLLTQPAAAGCNSHDTACRTPSSTGRTTKPPASCPCAAAAAAPHASLTPHCLHPHCATTAAAAAVQLWALPAPSLCLFCCCCRGRGPAACCVHVQHCRVCVGLDPGVVCNL